MKRENLISDMLIDYLNRMDMTIVRAAALTGLSIGTISKTINGKTRPNRRTAYKLEQFIAGKRLRTDAIRSIETLKQRINGRGE